MSTLILPKPSTQPDLYWGKYVAGLFANNERGVWYDPSDFGTLFQDASGVTPVTAVGQPVGLILDKSRGARLGPNLSSNPTYETGLGQTIQGNPGLVYWDQSNKRAVLQRQTGDTTQILIRNLVSELQVGRFYQISIDITNISCTQGIVLICSNLTSAVFADIHSLSSWVGQTRTYKYILPVERWYGNYWLYPQLNGVNVGGEIAVDNISCREVAGSHAYQFTSTRRPYLRQESNGLYKLEFDGIDDFLQTAPINFTNTDKMTVFAGVRKLSNNGQIICELSDNYNANTGSFYLVSGNDFDTRYTSNSRGTVGASVEQRAEWSYNYGYAPDTAVLIATHDISGDLSRIIRNEVIGTDARGDKGQGNFGNYRMYMGARGSGGLFFKGDIYELLVRGALTSANDLANVGRYFAHKTGVPL